MPARSSSAARVLGHPLVRAGFGLAVLALLTWWFVPSASMWVAHALVLIAACTLGWWAGGTVSSERREGAALARLKLAIEAAGIAPWEFDLLANRFVWLGGLLPAFKKVVPLEDQFAALEQVVLPEDVAKLRDEPGKAIANGADEHSFRYRMRGDDDRIHHIQSFLRIQRSTSGKPYRMVGASWDITEQVEANAKLEQQARHEHALSERLSMATECAGIAFWEIDLVAQRFVWVGNPMRALGLDESAYGSLEAFAEHVVPEDRTILPDAIRRCLKDGTRRFELRYRIHPTPDRIVHVQTFGRVLTNEAGRPLRALGVSWDVSREMAAAEAERRTEAAEAASAAKSSFLVNMSHEIRTPMNGIIGMTTLLLDTALDAIQREYADTIRYSGESLLTIVNDILDFSKIEAGKLELESIEVDLRRIVEEVGAILASQAATKGIELIVDVDDALPARVLGDPERLRQCLLNLTGNAVKFTRRGEIVVTVSALRGEHLHFEVRDTGVGIEPHALKSLFQPFVQADSSTTRLFGGTGLGLSIVRRLVEMMGGEVSVVSEPDHGSTFSFWIPLRVVATPELPVRAAVARKILIVDDNATTRHVLTARLQHAGHEVIEASNGADALRRLTIDGADLILYDAQLGDMDGTAFIAQRLLEPALACVPVVLMIVPDRRGEEQRAATPGCATHLTKPVRTRELHDCLVRTLAADDVHSARPVRHELLARTLTGNVLLVEDNAVNQKVARRILERLGCTVHVAANGIEGVAAAQAQRFDFVLMDLQMPVLDGFRAARRIRELPGCAELPIVALTANATPAESERCKAAGMNGFLTKPIDVVQLRDAMSGLGLALLDREAARSA